MSKHNCLSYLAAPYAHIDRKVMEQRLKIVNQITCELLKQGEMIYSPLTHNTVLDRLGIHGNWDTWKDFDLEMVSRCDQLIVLKLPGWEKSRGVTAEIAKARELDKNIVWMEPSEIFSLYPFSEDEQLMELLIS